jgi:hypothetical protein
VPGRAGVTLVPVDVTERKWTRVEYERLVEAEIVPGDPRDYRDAHPTHPVLVVEVALSRLGFHRDRKGSLLP